MKNVRTILTTLTALLIGFAFGFYLSRPPQVKAAGTVYLDKVTTGPNAFIGRTVIGFGCTETDCFIASE